MAYSVDGLSLLTELLRDGLGSSAQVMTRIPDRLPQYLPLVVVRRTGGQSPAPLFHDRFLINLQHWANEDRDGGVDAPRAAENLAETTRGLLWTAWRSQIVTAYGHIASLRESSAPRDLPDPDLPLIGRCMSVYDLVLRRPAGV